jgi:L-iditol 2-dehydrogenase
VRVQTLKAAVFYGPRDLRLEERDVPQVKDGEIVIKVDTSGLCPTDVKIYKSGSDSVKPPVVLGHEFAGTVHAIGSGVKGLKEGDRVNIPADAYCGSCLMCRSGKENLCTDPLSFGYQVDGAHADYVLIPKRFVDNGGVYKVPKNVSLEVISMAEPVACTYHDIIRLKVGPGKKLLVVGDGPMGLLHVLVAKAMGCDDITLAGLIDWKLKLGEEIGAKNVILSGSETKLQDEVKRVTPNGVDATALTVVTGELVPQALKATAKGGWVSIFAGVPKGDVMTTFEPNLIHYNEVSLIGSSGYTYPEYRKAFKIVLAHEPILARLVSHRFTLDKIIDAISIWGDKEKSLKIMIKR